MTAYPDDELYHRGRATLIASWEAYARGATDATVLCEPGVHCAVFPYPPERDVYNNAVLQRDLTAAERTIALDAMGVAYASAGVSRFAVWVHETDAVMCEEVERRGYRFDSSTRAMGMSLSDLCLPRPEIELGALDWSGYLRLVGLPADFLRGADHAAFHLTVARLNGEDVAAALAFDHDGDCGIYNVETLQHARGRGLGTALTALLLHDAHDRGCQTASLQSTPMAERLYAAIGFRDLGRIMEYEAVGY
jgi:ribosomal protein S18 acetylase RimI-like enzyme